MSTALAIGAVSEALRNFIDAGFVQANLAGAVGASVTVSAIAPDLIDLDSAAEPPRLNLFLYQVVPNTQLRNEMQPWHDSQGRRSSNPPLAVNLHYLLTAYGRSDAVAEMILGTAMGLLHETPRLTAAMLRALLDPAALPPTLLALADTRSPTRPSSCASRPRCRRWTRPSSSGPRCKAPTDPRRPTKSRWY
jgi:phage tail protein X